MMRVHHRGNRRLVAGCVAVLAGAASLAIVSSPVTAEGSQPVSTGLNADGQLGNGSTASRATPGTMLLPTNIVQIASGREHGYALAADRRVWAWGDNLRGAIGDGSNVDRPTPVMLSLDDVVQIEAGHYHGIALRADGTVWTWGYGGLGQLGLGTTNNRNAPVRVPGLNDIVSVAAGRDMSYAVRANGTMLAWGGNSFGEVGDGSTVRRTSPVAVSGLTSVVEVSGGRNHALAVRSDGTMWAWGANTSGQLGIGSTANRTTPVQLQPGQVAHVDAGAEHSIAVLIDGTVLTWGRGQRGQLGLGTTSTRTLPTPVPGLTGIVEVGDGRDQSFAMNAVGEVWAWGYNDTGQLGDGTTATRLAPVRIVGLTGIGSAQGGRGMTFFLPEAVDDPDLSAPTAPGAPTADSTIVGQVDLEWSAANDDRATTLTYLVYRDDGPTPIGSVTGGITGLIRFTDAPLTPGAIHTYTVAAFDGVNLGAASAASDPVTVFEPVGGPPALLTEDFTDGLSGWTVSGAVTIDPALGSSSAPSLAVTPNGSRADARRPLTTASSDACIAADVLVTSVTGTSRYSLVKARNISGSSMARLEVDQSGALSVRADAVGTVYRTAQVLPFGSWHRVALCVTAGSAGTIRAELDGTTIGSWNVSSGSQPMATIQIGDNSSRVAVVNFDDVVVTEV